MSTTEMQALGRILAEQHRRYGDMDLSPKERRRQLEEAQDAIVDAAKTTQFRGPIDPVLLHSVRDLSRFGDAPVNRR